jgi:hypothetical protein
MVPYSQLNKAEANLIDAIKEIEFGELLNVRLGRDSKYDLTMMLSPAKQKLINFLRQHKTQTIDRIQVHEGEPTMVIFAREIKGFRTVTKIKL